MNGLITLIAKYNLHRITIDPIVNRGMRLTIWTNETDYFYWGHHSDKNLNDLEIVLKSKM